MERQIENEKLTRSLIYIIFIIGILHTIYYYFEMPNEIASHFNAAGEADGYSEKDILLYLNLPVYTFILFLFELFVFLTPRIPKDLINLPNKEYWLSAERIKETHSVLRIYLRWMGIITLLLLMLVYHENYVANINNEKEIGLIFWIYLGVYLLLTVFIVLKMNNRFKRVQPS